MTSESRGRVQSMHSAVSSVYHGDGSALSSGELNSGSDVRAETQFGETTSYTYDL